MTTGYTREQLAELSLQIYESAPLEVTKADRKLSPKALDASMSGTEMGILLRLGFKRGEERDFFLNCAVMLKLVFDLYGAGETHGWWLKEYNDVPGFNLEAPTPSDLEEALQFAFVTLAVPLGPGDGFFHVCTMPRLACQIFCAEAVI